MSNKCQITFASRLDYHDGLADATVSAEVEHHIASGCDACTSDLAWLGAMMPAVQDALFFNTMSVSDNALQRAFGIMQREQSPSIVERIVTAARLLLDSRMQMPALSAARDLVDSGVHVVYRTPDLDVDLFQEQISGGSWYLTGQALPLSGGELSTPSSVHLLGESHSDIVADIVDSEFTFDDVPAGTYSLRLIWPGQEVVVDGLTIGAEAAELS